MKKLILVCCVMFVGMNSVQAAKLAEREELKRQLLSVNTGMNDYYLEKMYPPILNAAGRDLHPLGILLMFEQAQADYLDYITADKKPQQARMLRAMTQMSLEHLTPKLIQAILPNNKAEADEAIANYNEIHGLSEPGTPEGKSDL